MTRTQSGGGGSLKPRTAIEGSFSAWGGLGKLDRGLGRGEPFFPDSDSDSDCDETFQISRKLGRVHVEFFCLLDSQPCFKGTVFRKKSNGEYKQAKGEQITHFCFSFLAKKECPLRKRRIRETAKKLLKPSLSRLILDQHWKKL